MAFKQVTLLQRSFLAIALLLMYVPAWGATYYVDATGGGDGNTGTSTNTPWKTISKVNTSSFFAGDSILFKRGETWREQLTVPSSGSTGNPITFGAYGSGAQPVISGSDLGTTWTREGQTGYKTGFSQPAQVLENGLRMSLSGSKAGMTAGSWWWDATNSRVYIRCTGDADPSTKTIEVSQRSYNVYFINKSYLTIDGLNAINANELGIYGLAAASTNTGITVKNCTVAYAKRSGIQTVGNDTGPRYNDNWIIDSNDVSYSGAWGIVGSNHLKNSTIKNNTSHHNCMLDDEGYSAGIQIYHPSSTNNIIEHNTVYSNGRQANSGDRGYGIWLDTVGSGNVIRYNNVYGNRKGGIMVEVATAAQVYYNLSYLNGVGNHGRGIYLSRDCHNNVVYNNVAYGNDLGIEVGGTYPTPPGGDMTNNIVKNNISIGNVIRQFIAIRGGENDGTKGSGNIYTYNAFGPQTNNFIEWGLSTYKSTYADFDTAYGSATHSVTSDSRFISTVTPDFNLQSGSPAINAGTDVGLTSDYAGNSVPRGSAPEIGAFEYQEITNNPLSPMFPSNLIIN